MISIEFLGHIISSEIIQVDPRKTEAVINWPKPFAPTDIRSFLGLSRHYRRFVDGFAPLLSLLETLTEKM